MRKLERMRLFVDVDTQHDFCDPAGALFVRGGPAVMPNIVRLIEHASRSRALLVGSVDSHDFTAWEFESNGGPFPPHCVKGTPGWLKMPGTFLPRTIFIPNVPRTDHRAIADKRADAVLFEKEVYSLFANREALPVLDALLAREGASRSTATAIVFGIATDYCVKEAALGLRKHGFEVAVVIDAIAPVTEAGGKVALDEMRAAACSEVTTSRVIGERPRMEHHA
jgi:nicotinamidase/pyrazinamidase